jgi:aryl-alcohol dehydrogenase-like predicted oxidoreductase
MTVQLVSLPLGSTGMDISRVGFGSWAIGGGDWVSSWGPQDDNESIAAIRHAVDSGINWIDTAAVYGLGHSEEVVAKALEPYSDADRPYVFTKGGLVWNENDRRAASARIGEGSAVRQGVDDSLRRLGVEQIDLYFMHWPPTTDGTPLEDYWQTFLDLKSEGKLRAIGLSNHDRGLVERAEAVGHVDAVQPQFSAINPQAAEELLPWCAEHGTGAVVYSPMGSGLLTGRFSAERVASLAEDDWRATAPAFTTDLDANLSIAAAMSRVADRYGVTTASVAVAWVLGYNGVTGAIVGARTPAQVDGWLAAAALTLTADDYAEISAGIPRVLR